MKKLFLLFTLLVLSVVSLVGCKKKKGDAQSQAESEAVTYSEEEYDKVLDQIKQLKAELAIYDDSYKTNTTFKKKSVMSSGITEFNKVKDKIVLDGVLTNDTYFEPAASRVVIKIGGNIELDATEWLVETSSDTVHVSKPGHAYGKIYIKKFLDNYWDAATVNDGYIKPIFDANNIKASDVKGIYVNNSFIGQEASGAIEIVDTTKYAGELSVPASQILDQDAIAQYKLSEDSDINVKIQLDESGVNYRAKVRIGLGNLKNTAICYEFVSISNSGDSFITTLLRNMTIGGSPLHLN